MPTTLACRKRISPSSSYASGFRRQVPDFVYLESAIGIDPDKRDYVVSNAKIEATGFRPDWSLDAGIEELVKGYRMLRNSRFSNV